MNKIRVLLLLCLSLILCLTLLVGCKDEPDTPEDTTPDTTAAETEAPTEAPTDPETPTDIPTEPETDAPTEPETTPDTEPETDPVTEEETTNYFEANRIDIVEPDPAKISDMTIAGDGYDIFTLTKGKEYGYRYGCTYLYNDDGTIDAYFACVGTISGEWDWISYRHSPDGGQTWENEKVVLTPTQNSMDHFSNCDPGVVYFNGYYYLGYTSTLNSTGLCNNLFVSRSKNPDGPFEKWNGSGWGGYECQPIVYFDENWQSWGIGEPSFIELNGTLYMYYTSTSPSGNYTMVATADATNENWPATLEWHGMACKKGGDDSLDVKYVEEWGKFVAVTTSSRMGTSSYLSVYESNDGLHFTCVDAVKENTYQYLHNAGLSSRRNGHIRITEDADKLRVIYAYGDGWGIWNTRVQPITLVQGSGNDMAAERAKKNLPDPVNRIQPLSADEQYVSMVRTAKDVYVVPVTKASSTIVLKIFDAYFASKDTHRPDEHISFSDYDESVCVIDGCKIIPKGVGETSVIVHYDDLVNIFWVRITEEDTSKLKKAPVDFVTVRDSYTIFYGEKSIYKPQIRAQIRYNTGTFDELYVDEASKAAVQGEKITFSGYDESIISVNAQGIITAKAVGETDVTLEWNGYTRSVHVKVSADGADGYFSVEPVEEVNLENLDFTKKNTMESIGTANHCDYTLTGEATRLTATGEDTLIRLNYAGGEKPIMLSDYKGVEVTYRLPTTNKDKAPRAQMFIITAESGGASEAASMKQNLICDGEVHTLTFNFAGRDFWTGTLSILRWDFFDATAVGDVMDLISIKLIK